MDGYFGYFGLFSGIGGRLLWLFWAIFAISVLSQVPECVGYRILVVSSVNLKYCYWEFLEDIFVFFLGGQLFWAILATPVYCYEAR